MITPFLIFYLLPTIILYWLVKISYTEIGSNYQEQPNWFDVLVPLLPLINILGVILFIGYGEASAFSEDYNKKRKERWLIFNLPEFLFKPKNKYKDEDLST